MLCFSHSGMIKSSHQYLLLMDNANKALSLRISVFLKITTSQIPGVFCGRRRKGYPISYHIGNMLVKSLFSFSITCCIPSEPWWVCNIQRLSYHISLLCKQFWDEPWSDVNIFFHPMKYRPDQGSVSLSQSQYSVTRALLCQHEHYTWLLLMLKPCPRGEKGSSCWMLYVRMGNYVEVLEMSESVREIHDASSQSCSSLLVKKPNRAVATVGCGGVTPPRRRACRQSY